MLNPSQLEEMAKKIAEIIPQGVGNVPSGIKEQVKVIVSRSLEKMDLVSREEFDIQAAVLAKTRQKIEALEKVVSELEK
ncbi:MAG TPA: accessory factor UbiK family protein [Thiomicrorhabdus sp.]|nr:accessory factor UbiK family protein [Thiomicrorhabdus sp.]